MSEQGKIDAVIQEMIAVAASGSDDVLDEWTASNRAEVDQWQSKLSVEIASLRAQLAEADAAASALNGDVHEMGQKLASARKAAIEECVELVMRLDGCSSFYLVERLNELALTDDYEEKKSERRELRHDEGRRARRRNVAQSCNKLSGVDP